MIHSKALAKPVGVAPAPELLPPRTVTNSCSRVEARRSASCTLSALRMPAAAGAKTIMKPVSKHGEHTDGNDRLDQGETAFAG